jgi:nucleotide-binding universal stress UspA family protein
MTAERASVVIGYDGSDTSDHAIRESAALLAQHPALVVVVWEAGAAFEAAQIPTLGPGIEPAVLDYRAAIELDRALYEGARRVARRGADLAAECGYDAEALAVADNISVAETLVRLAKERNAGGLVVGAHSRSLVGELVLGSTSRTVIRHAPCPVVVVRSPDR